MSSLGTSNRSKRQATSSSNYGNAQGVGRLGAYHRGLNTLTRLTSFNANGTVPSGLSLGQHGGTRGSSSVLSGARTNIPRSVPKPLQTSSLKKENGGQDVTAVLVNRRNGSGKKVGWGSALPATPAPSSTTGAHYPVLSSTSSSHEPTPAETVENNVKTNNNSQTKSSQQPNTPADFPSASERSSSRNRNIPWALHPPTDSNSSSSRHPPDSAPYEHDRYRNERSMNDNNHNSELPPEQQHYSDQGYNRNYHRDFRDRISNSSHAYSSFPTDPHDHAHPHGYNDSRSYGHYDSFSRRPTTYDSSSRDSRESRPFARPPPDLDRGQPHFNSYDRHHHHHHGRDRDRDYQYDSEYRDYRDTHRGGYNNRGERSDHYSSRPPYDSRDGRRYFNERDEHRRWNSNSRYDHGNFPKSYDNGREIPRRHVADYRRGGGDYYDEHAPHHFDQKETNHEHSFHIDRNSRFEQENVFSDSARTESHNGSLSTDKNNILTSQTINPSITDARHQPPTKSEEDIVMQTIREREAAEARARVKKEMQTSGDNVHDNRSKLEVKEKTSDGSPDTSIFDNDKKDRTILRRSTIQVSGEASGDKKSEQCRVQIINNADQENDENKNVGDEIDMQDSSVVDELTKKNKDLGQSNPTTSRNEDMPLEMLNGSSAKQSNENTIQTSKGLSMNQAIKNTMNESLKPLQAEKEIVKPLTESQKEFIRKKKAIKQQQNVLRQVAAARENSKNIKKNPAPLKSEISPSSKDGEVNDSLQKVESGITNEKIDIKKIKQEKAAADAAAKEARDEYTKSRGPRTKGVLFRRLLDGTLINADLSEEQIAKREERKQAKIKKIQEKMEKRELKRLQAKKGKEEKLKKTNISAESKNCAVQSEEKVPNKNQSPAKVKTLNPAPPPPVSAWVAGPPTGFKTSTVSPEKTIDINFDLKMKSDLDQSLFPKGVDGTASNSKSDKTRLTKYTTFANNDSTWASQRDDQAAISKKKKKDSPFSSSSPLTLSVTEGIMSWNAFSSVTTAAGSLAIPSFSLTQNDIEAASGNWIVSQNYDPSNTSGKINIWASKTLSPTTEKENSVMDELSANVQDVIQGDSILVDDSKEIVSSENQSSNEANRLEKPQNVSGRRNQKPRYEKSKSFPDKNSKFRLSKHDKRFTTIKKFRSSKITQEPTSTADDTQDLASKSEPYHKPLKKSKTMPGFKQRRSNNIDDKEGKQSRKPRPPFNRQKSTEQKLEESSIPAAKSNRNIKPKRPFPRPKISRKPREKYSPPKPST